MTTFNDIEAEELRSFLVGSSLEISFLNQLDNKHDKKLVQKFTKWLGMEE